MYNIARDVSRNESAEIAEWNAQVEARKAAKRAAKAVKRA